MAITVRPDGSCSGRRSSGDLAKLRVDRRLFGRACPRHGVRALIVQADRLQLERIGDVTRNSARHRSAALREKQRPAERVQPLEVTLACNSLDVAPLGVTGQLTGHDGRQQKRHERDPVFRIRDRERADGRKKKEIERQHREDRRRRRLGDAPSGCNEQDQDDVGQGNRRGVDVKDPRIKKGDGRHGADRNGDAAHQNGAVHAERGYLRRAFRSMLRQVNRLGITVCVSVAR